QVIPGSRIDLVVESIRSLLEVNHPVQLRGPAQIVDPALTGDAVGIVEAELQIPLRGGTAVQPAQAGDIPPRHRLLEILRALLLGLDDGYRISHLEDRLRVAALDGRTHQGSRLTKLSTLIAGAIVRCRNGIHLC